MRTDNTIHIEKIKILRSASITEEYKNIKRAAAELCDKNLYTYMDIKGMTIDTMEFGIKISVMAEKIESDKIYDTWEIYIDNSLFMRVAKKIKRKLYSSALVNIMRYLFCKHRYTFSHRWYGKNDIETEVSYRCVKCGKHKIIKMAK